MCPIVPEKIVCSPIVAEKIEIVGPSGVQRGPDSGSGDVADGSGGQAAMSVSVVAAVVLADTAGGYSDVGVASVVECAVHLKAHPLLQAVVDHRSDNGHFAAVCRLFLDDRSDGEDPLPAFGSVGDAVFPSEPAKTFFAEIDEVLHRLVRIVTEGDVVTLGENSPFGIGTQRSIGGEEFFRIFMKAVTHLIEKNHTCLPWDKGDAYETIGRSETMQKIESTHAFASQVDPSSLGSAQHTKKKSVGPGECVSPLLQL